MAKFISRRDFLKGTTAGALGIAASGLFGSAVASAEGNAPAAEAAPVAAITWDDIFATSYSQANRRSNPDAKAPETPEEYIVQKGNGDILGSMMVGMVGPLGIPKEKFMNNKPAWLGDEPDLYGKVSYEKECDVLVIKAASQKLSGSIKVGNDSVLALELTEGSAFEGSIDGSIVNASGTVVSSEAGEVSVTLNSTSTWTLTGDSYITEFNGDLNNVNRNGYTLYVNGASQA